MSGSVMTAWMSVVGYWWEAAGGLDRAVSVRQKVAKMFEIPIDFVRDEKVVEMPRSMAVVEEKKAGTFQYRILHDLVVLVTLNSSELGSEGAGSMPQAL